MVPRHRLSAFYLNQAINIRLGMYLQRPLLNFLAEILPLKYSQVINLFFSWKHFYITGYLSKTSPLLFYILFYSWLFLITIKIMEMVRQYMVDGILKAGIRHDGGEQCYQEIPLQFHIICCCLVTVVHLVFMYKWHYSLSILEITVSKSSNFEKAVGMSCLICFILTFYYKLTTKKGIFILNPCHITLLIMTVLLFAPSTPLMKKIHTYWTSWLFGAYLALIVPHLDGISTFQIFLYYYQHLLIVPIGPLILKRRYGFIRPGFTNQITSFSSLIFYQLLVLTPVSRMTKANLNFTLCHSDADFLFSSLGYHYYMAGVVNLNFLSFICRWITYLTVTLIYKVKDVFMKTVKGGKKQN